VPDMPKLVKDDSFIKMMDEMVAEDLEILDEVISEDIDTLSIVANPEQLIGKPYNEWTPQDKQWLSQIYGLDSEILDKFIAKKELENLQVLFKQVDQLKGD
jgi:hypothetical protein